MSTEACTVISYDYQMAAVKLSGWLVH